MYASACGKKHLENPKSLISTIKTLVSIRMTLSRLTVLKPGNRRTAVSNGNGRKCFMPSEVWTAGMVGRTRAGMRPFWHVLPAGGGAKATCWTADSKRQKPEPKSFSSHPNSPSACVCLVCRLYRNVSSHWETSYLCYCETFLMLSVLCLIW